MQALYDAADDDSATGGPDVTRRIYPVVATVTADGFQRLTDDEAGDRTPRPSSTAGCARQTGRARAVATSPDQPDLLDQTSTSK